MKERVWISWNKQRRNIGLAEAVGAELYMSDIGGPNWLRLLKEVVTTWRIIRRERPSFCFAMNPSIFTSCWLMLLKWPYGFRLITDLHTCNIRLSGLKKMVFDFFFRLGVAGSDAVIVTNTIYRETILPMNPNVVCIPDALPNLRGDIDAGPSSLLKNSKKTKVLVVSSFDPDEPMDELLSLDDRINGFDLLVTGNWRKRFSVLPQSQNITFLGFVSDKEYDSLLAQVDAVMVLTTEEGCLCCGAYEAISAGKPLILSGTQALKHFFGEAPIFTDNSAESILQALTTVQEEQGQREKKILQCKERVLSSFRQGVEELERMMEGRLN